MFQRMVWSLLVCIMLAPISIWAQQNTMATYHFEGKQKSLSGKWNLVLGKHLSYSDLTFSTYNVTTSVPHIWNGTKWKGEVFNGKGIGTYYCKIVLPDDFSEEQLSLYMPEVGLAYRLYANESLIFKVGEAGTKSENSVARINPEIVNIPIKGQKEIVLMVQVSNFWHHNGGIWYTPIIGQKAHMRYFYYLQMTLSLLALGSIIIMGLYHFFLFGMRLKERSSLYFFFICVCLLFQTMTRGIIPLVDVLPEINWMVLKKMEYLSLFTVAGLNVVFIASLFPGLVHKRIVQYVIWVLLLVLGITILFSTTYTFYLIYPFQIITLLLGGYLIYMLLKAMRLRMQGSALLFVGFASTFLTVVNDILYSNYLIETFLMVHYGMFIYILALSLVLAKRFTTALNKEEQLTSKLENVNLELEGRVKLRTAQLEAQKEVIENQNSSLKQANEEQKQLMAIVAHDLKSPLNKILGLSEIMKFELEGEQLKMNAMIRNVAIEGRQLIENLILLRHFQSGKFKTSNTDFSIASLLEQKAEEFKNEARKKYIDIVLHNNSEDMVTTDKELIGRIIDNLLSNAIKFTFPSTKITVSSFVGPQFFQINVKDEGPGFTKEDRKLLFGRFQRLSANPTGSESSSGLGLSIVKAMVQHLQGEITLLEEEASGAEFELKIPTVPIAVARTDLQL